MLAKSRGLFYLELEGFNMNKTVLKTFVCSFVLSLSAILGADKVFFCAPVPQESSIKIPRKSIALFFGGSENNVSSSKVEPVRKLALHLPQSQRQEEAILQNISEITSDFTIKEIPLMVKNEVIPIQSDNYEEEVVAVVEDDVYVPLEYQKAEKKTHKLLSVRQEIVAEKQKSQIATAVQNVIEEEDLLQAPVVVKGVRQVVRVENKNKIKPVSPLKENLIVVNAQSEMMTSIENGDDVVVPDNQIADLGENIPIDVAEKAAKVSDEKNVRKWQTMAEKHQHENPWVVAKGSKFVKNKKVLEDFASEVAVKKAKDSGLMPKNIVEEAKKAQLAVKNNFLIPIPQDLLDKDDLLPNLGDDKGKKNKNDKVKKDDKDNSGSLLDSIASVFSKENKEKAIKKLRMRGNKVVDEETEKAQILPTEIRLSFQPNRAEISGQTLRWIQAFAKKATDEKNVGLEIRIDGSGAFALQQKRLNLLYNILTANGVEYKKINTVFADREANSFIVRTVKITNGVDEKKETDGWKKYYQSW